jgi:hypothetical protein
MSSSVEIREVYRLATGLKKQGKGHDKKEKE